MNTHGELSDAAEGAEIEAMRQDQIDAARYRYLRDHAFRKYGHLALLPPNEMDGAIDRAIASQGDKG